MSLFDRLKKSSDPIATATIANFATDEGESVAIVAKIAVATTPNAKSEIPSSEPKNGDSSSEDVSRLERISIMAEDVEPRGERLYSNGVDLGVHEGDPPHIRVFAWILVNLNTGESWSITLSKLSKECRLSEEL